MSSRTRGLNMLALAGAAWLMSIIILAVTTLISQLPLPEQSRAALTVSGSAVGAIGPWVFLLCKALVMERMAPEKGNKDG